MRKQPVGDLKVAESGRPENLPGPGDKVAHYELIRELGRGGMGVVYLARDLKLARRVAVKFIRSERRGLTARFVAEARATARCQHENIVIVHDIDQYAGTPYMVLEFLRGRSLRDLQGSAEMQINGQGTTVNLTIQGLDAATEYVSHVHALPCAVNKAGDHYKIEPTIDQAVEENELWPVITPGTAIVQFTSPHVARADAQSVVIHRVAGDKKPKATSCG
ncbi:MAG: protein kinase [Proteobacteria bacterium]|nr:protein kinase [Pseudomonadota bacterium]